MYIYIIHVIGVYIAKKFSRNECYKKNGQSVPVYFLYQFPNIIGSNLNYGRG